MPHKSSAQQPQWWHKATVYQIYPASFKDSNGDGIGDIPGIISKVPHIASLGVDAVWLSPCYKSPLVDMGYDISDYREIDPRYGTVADIETLIKELGKHNIKLLMDLVVNHTSDQHAWFQQSRSSKDNPMRDWYIWRKGTQETQADDTVVRKPPNNWESLFKGSAWTYDELTDEWYLRIFASEQPDLNWENPTTRNAVYEDMKFWLDKGIGGFRMDVINMISKPDGFPDAPVTKPEQKFQPAYTHYCNGPRIHEFIREINEQVLSRYPGAMSVGEVPFTRDPAVVRQFVQPERKELNMLFQFDIVDIDTIDGPGGKYFPVEITPLNLKSTIVKWQTSLSYTSGAWGTAFLESHDAARSVTRFGDRTTANRFKVAKMLSTLLTTISGTLFLMQGQEIGLANYTKDIPIASYGDIETKGIYNEMKAFRESQLNGAPVDMTDVEEQVRLKARDHGRIPMPWDASLKNAGFSDADKPWACINTDIFDCNFARQDKEVNSVLNYWRKMLTFRKDNVNSLILGDFEAIDVSDGPIFAYKRNALDDAATDMLVVLNLTNRDDVRWILPQADLKLVASTFDKLSEGQSKLNKNGAQTTIELGAYDGFVFST